MFSKLSAESFYSSFLREDEEIVYVMHKHWWGLLKPLAKAVLGGVLVPLFVFWLFAEHVISLVAIVWLVGGIIWLIHTYMDWYYDSLMITNEGVIDIEWRGFFDKNATRIDYGTVEGVEYEARGIVSTFLKFGHIKVGLYSSEQVELPYAANARKMQQLILDKRDEFHNAGDDGNVEALKEAIKSLLGDEMVKRKYGVEFEDDPYDDEQLEDDEDLPDDASYDDDLEDDEYADDPEEIEVEITDITDTESDDQDVPVMETHPIPSSKKKKSPQKPRRSRQKKSSRKTTKSAKKTTKKKAPTKKKSSPKAKKK